MRDLRKEVEQRRWMEEEDEEIFAKLRYPFLKCIFISCRD